MHQKRSKREPGVVSDDRGKSAQKARQQQRLRAALRENLKRRKAQARARAASSKRPENTPAPTGNADEDNAFR